MVDAGYVTAIRSPAVTSFRVEGYFICRYDTFDDQGRPREVRAVRLVPTCGGEDWQYIPSPATICWDGEHSMIRWHVPDDEAAWRAYGRE